MDNDNDKKTAVNALANEPITVKKNNSTALEELMAEMLGDAFVLRKETKALLDSIQKEREFFIQAIQTERDTYKKAFFEVTSLIESQQAEMEIAVSAGVRRINEATTENAKTIAEQMARNINAQTTEHGNAAKVFFDKNTAQSLDAITTATTKAQKAMEDKRNQLVGYINSDFLNSKVRGWFIVSTFCSIIAIGIVLWAFHDYESKQLRAEIWQATSQFTKTKH